MTLPHLAQTLHSALLPHLDPAIVCSQRDARTYLAAAITAHTERLTMEGAPCRLPARRLFQDIRWCFPLHRQARVLALVQRWVDAVDAEIDALRLAGYDPAGNPLRCPVYTRQGRQCERIPLRVNGYCPSHQHLVVQAEAQTA